MARRGPRGVETRTLHPLPRPRHPQIPHSSAHYLNERPLYSRRALCTLVTRLESSQGSPLPAAIYRPGRGQGDTGSFSGHVSHRSPFIHHENVKCVISSTRSSANGRRWSLSLFTGGFPGPSKPRVRNYRDNSNRGDPRSSESILRDTRNAKSFNEGRSRKYSTEATFDAKILYFTGRYRDSFFGLARASRGIGKSTVRFFISPGGECFVFRLYRC